MAGSPPPARQCWPVTPSESQCTRAAVERGRSPRRRHLRRGGRRRLRRGGGRRRWERGRAEDAVAAPGAGEPRGQEAGIERLAAGGMAFQHGVQAWRRAGGRSRFRRGPRRRVGASRARAWQCASDGQSPGPPVPGKQPIHAEGRSRQCARPQAVRTCPNLD